MILGFKQRFTDPIKNNIKVHTIREDRKNRWRAGNTIQAFIGVRQKWMEKIFNGDCISVQQILMVMENNRLHITVDRRRLKAHEVHGLAIKDGFDNVAEMIDWFFPTDQNGKQKVTMFAGKLIHWTDLKY